MDDMEERVNNRLRELSVTSLSQFTYELKQAHIGIAELKRKPIPNIFYLRIVEVEEDDIINLIDQPLKDKDKVVSKGSENMRSRKIKHQHENVEERVVSKFLKELKNNE